MNKFVQNNTKTRNADLIVLDNPPQWTNDSETYRMSGPKMKHERQNSKPWLNMTENYVEKSRSNVTQTTP